MHPFRLRSPFVRMPDVRGFQIVRRREGLRGRVVPRQGAEQELPARVREAVTNALAEAEAEVEVSVELVREPGPAAKVELVRSEIPR